MSDKKQEIIDAIQELDDEDFMSLLDRYCKLKEEENPILPMEDFSHRFDNYSVKEIFEELIDHNAEINPNDKYCIVDNYGRYVSDCVPQYLAGDDMIEKIANYCEENHTAFGIDSLEEVIGNQEEIEEEPGL